MSKELLNLLRAREERAAQDHLLSFVPHVKQRQFIDAVQAGEGRTFCYLGANRSGKSDAGAYVGASLARYGRADPRFIGGKEPEGTVSRVQVSNAATMGWVSALDYPLCRDVLQPKYFDNGFLEPGQQPFIPEHEVDTWRVSDQALKLKNGSMIVFKSAEAGRAKYQGKALDWFHMDEEHPFDIYQEVAIRVGGGRRLKILITATLLPPEGKTMGPSWLFDQLIRPWQEGTNSSIHITTASIYDNPHILEDEIKELEAIYVMGSKIAQIRLEGALIAGIGGSLAYPSFDRQVHIAEEALEIDRRTPLCWALDFNVEPFATVVGQRDGTMFNILRCLTLPTGDLGEMAALFRSSYPHHRPGVILYGDATGKNRTVKDIRSNYAILRQELAGYPLQVRVPEQNPPVSERINTTNRLLRGPEGKTRIIIDPYGCQELISDFEQVLRDPKGGILKVNDRRNPYFYRTHHADALDYWLWFDEPGVATTPHGHRRHRAVRVPIPGY